jgi:hypothetical protein
VTGIGAPRPLPRVPADPASAVAIPLPVKRHLGLDVIVRLFIRAA